MDLGLRDTEKANGIIQAVQEVIGRKWNEQFVVDLFKVIKEPQHDLSKHR